MDIKHPRGPHFLNRDLAKKCEPILALTNSAEPDLRAIVRQIEAVPTFSRRILRAANAARLGLSREVTSVEQAVALLGARHVQSVMEYLQFELFPTRTSAPTAPVVHERPPSGP